MYLKSSVEMESQGILLENLSIPNWNVLLHACVILLYISVNSFIGM